MNAGKTLLSQLMDCLPRSKRCGGSTLFLAPVS